MEVMVRYKMMLASKDAYIKTSYNVSLVRQEEVIRLSI